jgi:isopentenyl diphosphate isomerase/L-lactate dehydrogenase-like FMN-dependent dehydrogenase
MPLRSRSQLVLQADLKASRFKRRLALRAAQPFILSSVMTPRLLQLEKSAPKNLTITLDLVTTLRSVLKASLNRMPLRSRSHLVLQADLKVLLIKHRSALWAAQQCTLSLEQTLRLLQLEKSAPKSLTITSVQDITTPNVLKASLNRITLRSRSQLALQADQTVLRFRHKSEHRVVHRLTQSSETMSKALRSEKSVPKNLTITSDLVTTLQSELKALLSRRVHL